MRSRVADAQKTLKKKIENANSSSSLSLIRYSCSPRVCTLIYLGGVDNDDGGLVKTERE